DPETGRLLHSLKDHGDIVWSVAFSPDSKRLVSCGDDKTIRFWDVATGKQVRQIKHTDRVNKVALSPDGKLLAFIDVTKHEWRGGGGASWHPDHRVRLWDADTGKELRQLVIPAKEVSPGIRSCLISLAFAPDGKSLVAGESITG